MTLVYVSHTQPPASAPLSNIGGMQRVAEELLESLDARDEVDVEALLLRCSWKWIHIRIIPFLVSSFLKLRIRIVRGDLETILFSSMVTALLVIPLDKYLRASRVKTAVIVHGLDVTSSFALYQRWVRRVLGSIDLVLAVSQATGMECVARGLSQDRIHVIHNGVKTSRFETEPPLRPERTKLFAHFDSPSGVLPEDGFLLCSVGRHVERKGYAWFIEHVMPALPPNIHYWLAGDGPESVHIQGVVKRMNLSGRVRLLGKLSDPELMALYRGSDLFIMPNIKVRDDMEGFGIVMLEAGMNGLPSIAARIEGIEEVILEGKNGYFVRSGDAEGFVRAISSYVSETQNMEAARKSAFDYTRDTFGWETISDRVVKALS